MSFEGKFDSSAKVYSLMRVGDCVKLVFWESTTDGDYWVFTSALIQSYSLTVDVDGKTVIGWSATAGADGVFYAPGDAGAPAETAPA